MPGTLCPFCGLHKRHNSDTDAKRFQEAHLEWAHDLDPHGKPLGARNLDIESPKAPSVSDETRRPSGLPRAGHAQAASTARSMTPAQGDVEVPK